MSSNEDTFHLGVKALICNKENELLLVERERRSKFSTQSYWDLPGGRIQKGETQLQALRRELEEEVGLQTIDEVYPLGMYPTNVRIPQPNGDVGLILALYAVTISSDFIPQLGEDHTSYGWFLAADASSHLEDQYPPELLTQLRGQLLGRALNFTK